MKKLALSNVFEEDAESIPLEDADAAEVEEVVLECCHEESEKPFEKEAAHPENFIWHPARKF